jgi:hypothetical protein
MQVTSDSLFHFTTTLKNLQSILSQKFKLSYCKEEYKLGIGSHKNYFPMVTFCDIPLSLAKEHIKKYGCYAIGLTKSWGIEHKLNPVLYVEKSSLIAKDIDTNFDALKKALDSIIKIEEKKEYSSDKDLGELAHQMLELKDGYLNVLRYLKNYEGSLIRNEKVIDPNYRFYDEREWRFVPEWKNEGEVKGYLSEGEYLKFRGPKTSSKPMIDGISLNFKALDIKYLIVKSNSDIPKLIRFINATDELTKNPDEADILTTKILTVDQLKSDF